MATERRAEAKWDEKRKTWVIKVQKDGRRQPFYSSTPGAKGKREAEGKADEWLASNSEVKRFEKAWKEFLDYYEKHYKEGYKKHESMGRLWIEDRIKNKPLDKITPMDWQKCVNAPHEEKDLSRRTCENVAGTISAFISFCRMNEWKINRPEKGQIKIPKNAKVGERKILQPSDIMTLFTIDYYTHYKKQKLAYFVHAWRFILLTGLRRGELCGLRKEDIEGNILHINRSINTDNEETGGKNDNARRYVAVSEKARTVLQDQAEMLKKAGIISPWIFPDELGERLDPNHLYKKWYTYRNQHGITTSIHEMRHTFISVVKSDMPESLLKSMVGHGVDMDTFGVYGHRFEGDIRRTANIIDEVFSRIV